MTVRRLRKGQTHVCVALVVLTREATWKAVPGCRHTHAYLVPSPTDASCGVFSLSYIQRRQDSSNFGDRNRALGLLATQEPGIQAVELEPMFLSGRPSPFAGRQRLWAHLLSKQRCGQGAGERTRMSTMWMKALPRISHCPTCERRLACPLKCSRHPERTHVCLLVSRLFRIYGARYTSQQRKSVPIDIGTLLVDRCPLRSVSLFQSARASGSEGETR